MQRFTILLCATAISGFAAVAQAQEASSSADSAPHCSDPYGCIKQVPLTASEVSVSLQQLKQSVSRVAKTAQR